jgi:hypothetical protein
MAANPDPKDLEKQPAPQAETAAGAQPEPNTPKIPATGIPGKKATKAQVAARVAEVEGLAIAGANRAQIVRHAAEKWGVKKRQVDTYIARAAASIRESSIIDRDYELGLAVKRAHYLFQAAMKVRDFRLGAAVDRDRRKLLGLDQPEQIKVTAEHTGEVKIYDQDRLTRMTLEELRKEELRLREHLGATGRTADDDQPDASGRPN